MSSLTDLLDRISGVASLKDRLQQQDKVLERIQKILLEQQKDIAEIKGTLKALIAMNSQR